MHEQTQGRGTEPGVGNSFEVAVDNAVHKAQELIPDQREWRVDEVIVVTGNPHIKEYKVSVAPSP